MSSEELKRAIKSHLDANDLWGAGFTYGTGVYSMVIKDWFIGLEASELEEQLIDEVTNQLQADRKAVSMLTLKALVEVVDLAVLDRIVRELIGETEEV